MTEVRLVDISPTKHNSSNTVKLVDQSTLSSKKETLLSLRDLIVKQEHKHRVVLQQKQHSLRQLERNLKKVQERVEQKNEELENRRHNNFRFQGILTEFEKTADGLKRESEANLFRFRESNERLRNELAAMKEHLPNTQKAYEDLLIKYQSTEKLVENMPPVLTELKDTYREYVKDIENIQAMFLVKKQEAYIKCERLNEEMALLKQKNEEEMTRWKSLVKKSESRIRSLKVTLEQKTMKNKTLVTLCDELLNCELKEESE